MTNTTTYDTRLVVARMHDGILLRLFSSDDEFMAEYSLGYRADYRIPMLRTIGSPEPGLPMRQIRLATIDLQQMLKAMVCASENEEEQVFCGDRLSGSYRLINRHRGRFFLQELLGSGFEVASSVIKIDILDLELLRHSLQQ
jgi:hypothetical protein